MGKSNELDEAKRIMGRLVSTPPKPHGEMKKGGVNRPLTIKKAKKKPAGPPSKKDRPEAQ